MALLKMVIARIRPELRCMNIAKYWMMGEFGVGPAYIALGAIANRATQSMVAFSNVWNK